MRFARKTSKCSHYRPLIISAMSSSLLRFLAGSALVCGFSGVLTAQQPSGLKILTTEDYARAERFMPYNTAPLVLHSAGRANWLPDDRYWYRTTTEKGNETILVD